MIHAPGGRAVAGMAIALVTAALMVATGPRLAIVWDEGHVLGREARVRAWFQALRDPASFADRGSAPFADLVPDNLAPPRPDEINTRAKLFQRRVIDWFWPFGREEPHGHPPFYAIVGMAGDLLAPSWPILARARLGPMLVFSLTAGALFVFVSRRWGNWAGALASGAWTLQPNLFAQGHYAGYDALLSALWVGSIMAFAKAVEPPGADPAAARSRRPLWVWVAVFGAIAGCAADTKLTGWFLPLPFLAWVALTRDRRGLLALLVGGLVAVVVLYGLNPPWWNGPIAGFERFLRSNLTRSRTIKIPVLFLGRIYSTPDGSLPWYNTLVWTVLVTPVGFLELAIVGLVRSVRRRRAEPIGLLIVGHWAYLQALRALPHTPGHDGVRQFLPTFGVLAMLAALGAASAVERLGRWGRLAVVAALAEGAASVALMMPVPLSYYSPIVGGLPGASAIGMEPTYFWDALSDDALDWLNRNTGAGQKVAFATFPTSWIYLHRTGRLTPAILPSEPGIATWYVLQNRPGAASPLDRALIARGHPAYVVSKWGVPLVWIFPYREVEALLGPASGR